MPSIILNGITTEQFKELFLEVIKEHLGLLPKSSNEKSIEKETQYLTRAEVARKLQISLPTLHDYTKRELIPSYRIGSKVRYKALDIEKALTERIFSFRKKGGRYAA